MFYVAKLAILYISLFFGEIEIKPIEVIDISQRLNDYLYVYRYANTVNTPQISHRIANLVVLYCYKKELDVKIVARIIWKESRYRRTVFSRDKNGKPIAYGLMQVNLRYWAHLFYYTLDRRYSERLLKNPKKYLPIIATYLEANIDVGTTVLRYYLDMYNDDYSKALIGYWAGQDSIEMKNYIEKGIIYHYAKDILFPEKELYVQISLYHGLTL